MGGKMQNAFVPEDILIPHFGVEKPIIGIEIGVSGGCGSLGMLLRLPNLVLYCIDPWLHFPGEPFEASFTQETHDFGYEETKKRLAQFSDRCVILRMTSDEAVKEVPPLVDFIFIDGHHTYDQAKKDIQNYSPLVRKGGIIAGHDYVQVPEVKAAVDEMFINETIHTGDDFVWWVYA